MNWVYLFVFGVSLFAMWLKKVVLYIISSAWYVHRFQLDGLIECSFGKILQCQAQEFRENWILVLMMLM